MTTITVAAKARAAHLKLHIAPACHDRPLRLLCATDLWERSDFALQRTLSLAASADARPLLLHVVDKKTPLRIAGLRADRARSALLWRTRKCRRSEAPPAISVRIGNPRRTIARVAREWETDLIVLGAYRPRAGDWLFGTTAERLARDTGCAVLIVNREPCPAYGDIVFAARSLPRAHVLARTLRALNIADSMTARYRAMLYWRSPAYPPAPAAAVHGPCDQAGANAGRCEIHAVHQATFDAAARALLNDAPELVVTDHDRYPALTRAFKRNMVNTLQRSAAFDVLISPRAENG